LTTGDGGSAPESSSESTTTGASQDEDDTGDTGDGTDTTGEDTSVEGGSTPSGYQSKMDNQVGLQEVTKARAGADAVAHHDQAPAVRAADWSSKAALCGAGVIFSIASAGVGGLAGVGMCGPLLAKGLATTAAAMRSKLKMKDVQHFVVGPDSLTYLDELRWVEGYAKEIESLHARMQNEMHTLGDPKMSPHTMETISQLQCMVQALDRDFKKHTDTRGRTESQGAREARKADEQRAVETVRGQLQKLQSSFSVETMSMMGRGMDAIMKKNEEIYELLRRQQVSTGAP